MGSASGAEDSSVQQLLGGLQPLFAHESCRDCKFVKSVPLLCRRCQIIPLAYWKSLPSCATFLDAVHNQQEFVLIRRPLGQATCQTVCA